MTAVVMAAPFCFELLALRARVVVEVVEMVWVPEEEIPAYKHY